MAVLKFLVSAALLGTVARTQNIYSAFNPGGQSLAQYSPSILSRGTPRLIPIKPQHQQQSFDLSKYQLNPEQPQLAYQAAAATSAPAVLKRGRVISGTSAYTLDSGAAALASPTGSYHQYAPHSIPAVSTYRPAPLPQQIAAAPVSHHHRLRPQQVQPQFVAYQPQIQPNFYIQKSPVVVGPSNPRPHKLIKVKKIRPVQHQQQQQVAQAPEEEEEYPGDPNPQYNFSFDIKDDELTNYQNRQEERDGQTIKGSYSVVDPDGYVRTVTYTADPKNGFQAKVTREPTDVKIKFPVPTEAPTQGAQKNGRRPVYVTQQFHQPQYQTASYASPHQVYTASGSAPVPVAASIVDAGSAPVSPTHPPSPFTRSLRRFSSTVQQQTQPQAEASEPQPKVVVAVARTVHPKLRQNKTQTVNQEEATTSD